MEEATTKNTDKVTNNITQQDNEEVENIDEESKKETPKIADLHLSENLNDNDEQNFYFNNNNGTKESTNKEANMATTSVEVKECQETTRM